MTYKIIWTPEAERDIAYWKVKNKSMLRRISELVADIKINPKFGIGKPERLKYQSENVWSRRIDKKHRLVYLIRDGGVVLIIQCRFHYRDR